VGYPDGPLAPAELEPILRPVPRTPSRFHRALLLFAVSAAANLPIFASSPASPWSVRPWQTDDGLPNNQVTGLAQTSDGYLWIATPSRIVRFDGVAFEAFLTADFAPALNQRPAVLHATAKGLWVGFDHGGVAYLERGTVRVFTAGLPDRVPQSIVIDGGGTVWITYRAGVTVRLTTTGAITASAAEGYPGGYVASLASDAAGRLWYGKNGRIGVFHDGKFDQAFALSRATTRIAAGKDGGVWLCVGRELYHCPDGERLDDRGALPNVPATAEPTALLQDGNGGVWIGTSDSGLFHYANGTFESVPTSHRAISCLLEDREGSLWVGTDGGGLNRVRPRAITLRNTTTGLPFDTAQSLAEDTKGDLWAATQNGLLVRATGEAWEVLSNRDDWPGGRPTTVAADPAGGIWIGTKDYAVHRLRDGRYTTWHRGDGLLGHTIHALKVARNGDVWLGEESPDLVQRIRGQRIDTFPLPAGVRMLRAITEDSAGDIWVGTSKGYLFRIHGNSVDDETPHIIGPNGMRSVRYLQAMPDGRVWIAYADEGLGLYQNGEFGQLTMEQGLPDNNLSQITWDDDGWLWVGGDHGVFKARASELEAAAWQHGTVRVVRYGQNEGLASLQANSGDSPSVVRRRDGHIWMPLRTAVAVIDPREQHRPIPPPPVVLKRVTVNDTAIAAFAGVMPAGDLSVLDLHPPNLQLAADHRRLEIEYTALTYAAPENVRFRHRLIGFDDGWVDAGTQRMARYARLPAGDYRFQVEASNTDGVWNETPATVAFTVTPFFWSTWWFRLLAVVAVLGSAFAIVRQILLRRLRRRVQALEQQTALDRERARIARDMHDDLGSRLTHVALLVELTQRASADTRDSRISQIATTVRRASESLDEIVWAINPVNDVFPRFVNYVGQYAIEFSGAAGLRCRVDLPDALPPRAVSPEVRHNLFLVVKEALTNIVRHAEATEVRLRATIAPDSFTLAIEDDGRGFSGKAEGPDADGLRNMRDRMREIGGQVEIRSAPGRGAIVVLTLPWSRETPFTAPARLPLPTASTAPLSS
jgi:signal transduction histidine kinase/ligand-binding sensor domain-containing protein